jgi:lipoprotein NlpD
VKPTADKRALGQPGFSVYSFRALARLLAVVVLTACARQALAPVNEQGKGLREPEATYREVVAGDTLYSIAWESGRDYRELAGWNNIAAPFLIKPGQKLRLNPPLVNDDTRAATNKPTVPTVHVVKRGETLYRIGLQYDVTPKDIAAWNQLPPPYQLRPGQKLRLTSPETPGTTAGKATRKKSDKPITASGPSHAAPVKPATARESTAPRSGNWHWPAEGQLLGRFNNASNKGIDIAGKKGQAILAADQGQVVYQGGGLRGYGQLIIIKHNAEFLSAYAHCDRIYVKEGDVVKRAQKIADIGSSGTDRIKLHFEIRYRGNPVDPMTYLPRK